MPLPPSHGLGRILNKFPYFQSSLTSHSVLVVTSFEIIGYSANAKPMASIPVVIRSNMILKFRVKNSRI